VKTRTYDAAFAIAFRERGQRALSEASGSGEDAAA